MTMACCGIPHLNLPHNDLKPPCHVFTAPERLFATMRISGNVTSLLIAFKRMILRGTGIGISFGFANCQPDTTASTTRLRTSNSAVTATESKLSGVKLPGFQRPELSRSMRSAHIRGGAVM